MVPVIMVWTMVPATSTLQLITLSSMNFVDIQNINEPHVADITTVNENSSSLAFFSQLYVWA